jgi:hypothetical protein
MNKKHLQTSSDKSEQRKITADIIMSSIIMYPIYNLEESYTLKLLNIVILILSNDNLIFPNIQMTRIELKSYFIVCKCMRESL